MQSSSILRGHHLLRQSGDAHRSPKFLRNRALVPPFVQSVLVDLGFGNTGITREDILVADQVVQLERAPNLIDILTGISGIT